LIRGQHRKSKKQHKELGQSGIATLVVLDALECADVLDLDTLAFAFVDIGVNVLVVDMAVAVDRLLDALAVVADLATLPRPGDELELVAPSGHSLSRFWAERRGSVSFPLGFRTTVNDLFTTSCIFGIAVLRTAVTNRDPDCSRECEGEKGEVRVGERLHDGVGFSEKGVGEVIADGGRKSSKVRGASLVTTDIPGVGRSVSNTLRLGAGELEPIGSNTPYS